MTTTAPQLTEIDHVAIAVNDLEAAIDYYQRAFGATVEHREVVESDGVEEALLKVAESYIQLLTPTRDDSPVAKALEKRGEGPAPRRLPRRRLRRRARRRGGRRRQGHRRRAPARLAWHDRRLRPSEGILRHAHRAGPGVGEAHAHRDRRLRRERVARRLGRPAGTRRGRRLRHRVGAADLRLGHAHRARRRRPGDVAHRARHRGRAHLPAPPDDAGGAGPHHQRRGRRPAGSGHRPLPQGRDRRPARDVLRQARGPHARLPEHPPAPAARAGRQPPRHDDAHPDRALHRHRDGADPARAGRRHGRPHAPAGGCPRPTARSSG